MANLKSFLVLSGMCLLLACQPNQQQNTDNNNEVTAETDSALDNQLSESERSDGWMLLFDGVSTNGWRIYNTDTIAGWAVENGELVALGTGGLEGHGADIISSDTFSNFELQLDWKIASNGNSGIFFNVVEGEQYSTVYETGPEYQLLDDEGFSGKVKDVQTSGANYDMQAPAGGKVNPAGTYNHTVLKVLDGHVEHWLNGTKVVEYDLWTSQWEAAIQNSKWVDYPDYGKAKSGFIALQDHGNKTWFKNIKIKKLDANTN